MTNQEAKDALSKGYPVVCGGIEYLCITAIIVRAVGDKFYLQAELLDKCKNSVTITSLDKVTRKGEES